VQRTAKPQILTKGEAGLRPKRTKMLKKGEIRVL